MLGASMRNFNDLPPPSTKFVNTKPIIIKQPPQQKTSKAAHFQSVKAGNDIKHVFTFSTEDITRENPQTTKSKYPPKTTLKFVNEESSEISNQEVSPRNIQLSIDMIPNK